MDPEHPLTEVEELLDKIRPVTPGTWSLYAINKELGLHHGPNVPKYSTLIAILTTAEINHGLPTWKWQSIEDCIRILRKKGVLCPQPQKH